MTIETIPNQVHRDKLFKNKFRRKKIKKSKDKRYLALKKSIVNPKGKIASK